MPALPSWRVRSQACFHCLELARVVWAVGTASGSGPRNSGHCWVHKESVEQVGGDEGGPL
jgi:hypothetical protein